MASEARIHYAKYFQAVREYTKTSKGHMIADEQFQEFEHSMGLRYYVGEADAYVFEMVDLQLYCLAKIRYGF